MQAIGLLIGDDQDDVVRFLVRILGRRRGLRSFGEPCGRRYRQATLQELAVVVATLRAPHVPVLLWCDGASASWSRTNVPAFFRRR